MQDFSSYFLRMLNYLSTISFWDVIDILIVAYLFYKVIDLVRKTSSYNRKGNTSAAYLPLAVGTVGVQSDDD